MGHTAALCPAHHQGSSNRLDRPSRLTRPDARWNLAGQLLNDNTLATADRVAGLLVLLYAQTASSILRLTTSHVTTHDGTVMLHLGDRPIRLPSRLDTLMLDLLAMRPPHRVLQHESEWIFPGRRAGRPIHESQMLRRLHAIGIKPRHGRNTALFALAQQLPAGQLAKMLGLHIGVAVTWQRASGGDWMAYAAAAATRSAARPDLS